MASFSQDKKWVEAKRAVGNLNWLEVISYYRSIEGKNVFVYSVVEGAKRLIVDILNDETVLLINKDGTAVIDTYANVLQSRKIFKYNEDHADQDYSLAAGSSTYTVAIEKSQSDWT